MIEMMMLSCQLIVMNMKKEVCEIINPFLSFLTNMMKGGLIVMGNEVKSM
jgi:hypothetical protein